MSAILERSKTFAQKPGTQRAARLGGVSAATLGVVYQLFVTQAQYASDKQEATRKASVQWQKIMDLENDLDAARMDIVRLQTLKTNTP